MNPKTQHEKIFDIVWGDMDALGHVNNGRYFDYFQEARIEWLQTLNLDLNQKQGPVLIHIACTFLQEIVYPARLKIISRAHSPGRSSMMMDHEIYQKGNLKAQGTSKIVWVDYSQNKSTPLPEAIRALFD